MNNDNGKIIRMDPAQQTADLAAQLQQMQEQFDEKWGVMVDQVRQLERDQKQLQPQVERLHDQLVDTRRRVTDLETGQKPLLAPLQSTPRRPSGVPGPRGKGRPYKNRGFENEILDSPLLDRLQNAMGRTGVNATELAAVLGVSRGAANKWRRRLSEPKGQNLERLIDWIVRVESASDEMIHTIRREAQAAKG